MLSTYTASLAAPAQFPTLAYSFDAYAADFHKTYAVEERGVRAAAFSANLAKIMEQNAKYQAGEDSWFAAVNEYTDLTNAEFTKLRTGLTEGPPEPTANALKSAKAMPTTTFFPVQESALIFDQLDLPPK